MILVCVPGPSEENSGLPWRLDSDRGIVARDKTPIALCEMMRKLTVEQGLVDVDVEFHVLAQKRHPTAAASWFRGLGILCHCLACLNVASAWPDVVSSFISRKFIVG